MIPSHLHGSLFVSSLSDVSIVTVTNVMFCSASVYRAFWEKWEGEKKVRTSKGRVHFKGRS